MNNDRGDNDSNGINRSAFCRFGEIIEGLSQRERARLADREFSQEELEILHGQSRRTGYTLDQSDVADHIERFVGNADEWGGSLDAADFHPNKHAAWHILCRRVCNHIASSIGGDGGTLHHMLHTLENMMTGLSLLQEYAPYWIFEPTIEKLRQLNEEESLKALKFIRGYETSDYANAAYQQSGRFFEKLPDWDPNLESAENVRLGVELYDLGLSVLERGYPVLLGLKRMLDGEDPDLQHLQSLRLSSVRAELRDPDKHANSAYFDLIVKQWNSDIRNGIKHGDVTVDPVDGKVKIPSRGKTLSFSQFNRNAARNFGSVILLTGLLESVIAWHLVRTQNEEMVRVLEETVTGELVP